MTLLTRNRRCLLDVAYFDDRILLGRYAWAWFRLPTVSYEMRTPEEREALAIGVTTALSAIRMPDAEVHLRVANRAYPAEDWALDLLDRNTLPEGQRPGPGPLPATGWPAYVDQMYRHVWKLDYWTKEVYLGVRLGQRGMQSQLAASAFGPLARLYSAAEGALGITDPAIDGKEIAKWTGQAERLGRALAAGALGARHATAGEVAWLLRHAVLGTAGEPVPSAAGRSRWGAGEVVQLVEGEIENDRKVLRLIHGDAESYVAHLSFSRFPDVMAFPDGEPWLHFADSLPFPVEVSSRMQLIPPAKASKDVGRRLAHARDMDTHIREAGRDAPIALEQQVEQARLLEHGITKDRLPFVYGWHRLIVTAPDRKECAERAEAVIEHYRDIGVDVRHPTGDQFALLREQLPGDERRVGAYVQRQPLYTVAGGMPTATVELGDRAVDGGWVGPYVGYTLGRARSIVHFDPLVAAARNRPTAIAVTGEPGGGKSTLAMLLTLQLALRGVTNVIIDPKGETGPLVDWLNEQGRPARIVPLGSVQAGLLDPFAFGDDLAAKRTMATETLRLLLPHMSEARESAMIQAVGAVAEDEEPSLGKVVTYLEWADDAAARNLGYVLHSMAQMRLAKLCFAPSGGQDIHADGWTTVFTLEGLSLPDVSVKRDDYSYEQRLSVALLYLVSQFARRLLSQMDRHLPKAIFLDEAWALTSTPEGAKLVPEVSRMGRSKNTALILVSQNAGDLLNEQVLNCVSSVFAFRSLERREVDHVLELLGVEHTDAHREALRGLGNGECIMRDLDGRAGRVAVDLVSEELLRRLDTNPTRQHDTGLVPA